MLKITPIPALESNYIWVIESPDTRPNQCYIVDPGEAQPVIDYLTSHTLELIAILVTHRHSDHTNGIEVLRSRYKCPVIGPMSPAIPSVTSIVAAGDELTIFDETAIVMDVKGHTEEHIAYFISSDTPLCFVGDALFAGGCGNRLLDAETMYQSLQAIASLPLNTRLYCGHEYTANNLRFAQTVEPHNTALAERIQTTRQCLARGQPTIPSLLSEELATNPFLRVNTDDVRQYAEVQENVHKQTSDANIFAILRRAKDKFR